MTPSIIFFCNMACHLCFSHSLSNILQSPVAPESINPDRWVFYGAHRYIRTHTQTRCRVHIQTKWWDRFVAYKWHQLAESSWHLLMYVFESNKKETSLLRIFSIIKSSTLCMLVLMLVFCLFLSFCLLALDLFCHTDTDCPVVSAGKEQ